MTNDLRICTILYLITWVEDCKCNDIFQIYGKIFTWQKLPWWIEEADFNNGPYYRRTDHNSGYLHPSINKQYDNHTLWHDDFKKMRMTNSWKYCSLYFLARLHTMISLRFMTSRVISSHSIVNCVVRIGRNWLPNCQNTPLTSPTRSWSKFGTFFQNYWLEDDEEFRVTCDMYGSRFHLLYRVSSYWKCVFVTCSHHLTQNSFSFLFRWSSLMTTKFLRSFAACDCR